LNLCRDPSHFRCFDTADEKIDEMWMVRPVYPSPYSFKSRSNMHVNFLTTQRCQAFLLFENKSASGGRTALSKYGVGVSVGNRSVLFKGFGKFNVSHSSFAVRSCPDCLFGVTADGAVNVHAWIE